MSHELLSLARRVANEHPGEYTHLVIAADVLCRICTADLTLDCPRCSGNPYKRRTPSNPLHSPPRLDSTHESDRDFGEKN